MSNLTPSQIAERRQKLQEEALESVMARGQFNFRLDGADIRRLYSLAGERKKPVSAMVRDWVLERLAVEEKSDCSAPLWAKKLEDHLINIEAQLLAFAKESKGTPYQSSKAETNTKKVSEKGRQEYGGKTRRI